MRSALRATVTMALRLARAARGQPNPQTKPGLMLGPALALAQVASACAARRAVATNLSTQRAQAAPRCVQSAAGPSRPQLAQRAGGRRQRGPSTTAHCCSWRDAERPRATAVPRRWPEPRGVISLLSAQGLTLDSDDNARPRVRPRQRTQPESQPARRITPRPARLMPALQFSLLTVNSSEKYISIDILPR